MADNKFVNELDGLLKLHRKFDDLIENTHLKKEDAILEVISLCTGWLKKHKVSKEDVNEIILDTYEEWQTEEENKANVAIASQIKKIKDQIEKRSLINGD